MKLELIGHDEKYALEQSLLTLFPGEKPIYGTVDKTADTRWARVTLTEEDERVQVTTELGMDGKSAAHSYDYPLSGTEYEKEGQRRHAVGAAFQRRVDLLVVAVEFLHQNAVPAVPALQAVIACVFHAIPPCYAAVTNCVRHIRLRCPRKKAA